MVDERDDAPLALAAPESETAPYTDSGDYMAPAFHKKWALVEEGRVLDVKHHDGLLHPFGDEAKDRRVLDVTGVRCAPGFVADSKGNVAPPLPNGDVLMGHEPAYHDRSTAGLRPSAVYVSNFQTKEPHPLEKDNPDALRAADFRGAHPTAGLVQEGPFKSENEPNATPASLLDTKPDKPEPRSGEKPKS